MGNIVFNIAKGKVGYYAGLPAANDALIAVPLETSGIVSDATMKDIDDLSTLLAGATNEQTSNMTRKTLASVTSVVNDTDDRWDVDAADITWTAATGNAVSAVVICYDPDTTGGTDSDLIPLVKLDMVVTPSGGDITLVFASGGFYQAS
jgi:hypothetical protein